MTDARLQDSDRPQTANPPSSGGPDSQGGAPDAADSVPAALNAGTDTGSAPLALNAAESEPIASGVADILPPGTDISSTLIVDGTLWVLIAFSVATWALILIKGIQHLRVSYSNKSFGKKFWAAPNLQAATQLHSYKGPIGRVTKAGFNTLIEADGGTTTHDLEHTGDRQELLERRLRQQVQKERGALESGLAILATVGSISPFVGLFGTVWGIMGALTSISKSGSASLDVVAGPIGEALIATAVGIAVAVPAVIAYNFFIRRNKVVLALLDDFAIDFIHLALKTSFLIASAPETTSVSAKPAEVTNKKPSVVKTSGHESLIAKGAPA